jgi:hypothetical protein
MVGEIGECESSEKLLRAIIDLFLGRAGDEAPAAACFFRFPMHPVVAATAPVSTATVGCRSSSSIKATSCQTCFGSLLFPPRFPTLFQRLAVSGFHVFYSLNY